MDSNYIISDGIFLKHNGKRHDLHNDFQFKQLLYIPNEQQLTLVWQSRDLSDCILAIEFSGVTEFRFLPRNSNKPFTEDDCVSSVGYWVEEEWHKGLITITDGDEINPDWLFAIEFMSGSILMLRAKTSTLTFKDD